MLSLSRKTWRSAWLPTINYSRSYAKLSKAQAKVVEENKQIIANALGVSPECAHRIWLKDPSITTRNPQHLQKIPKILEKYEFPLSLYLESSFLWKVSPSYLESKILILRETGINYKSPYILKRFRKIVNTWISTLRLNRTLPRGVNVVENYIEAMPILEKDASVIRKFVPADTENMNIYQLRTSILVPYISTLLSCDTEVSQKIIKLYPRIAMRSFCWIYEAAKILKENFDFDDAKIQSHGYLLARTPESLRQMEKEFQSHGIPLESISRFPEVFTLTPSTVRQRLEDLDEVPELKVLKNHPRVVRLVYYQATAKKRLKELHSQLLSLNTLSANVQRYERFFDEKARWRGLDIFSFLQSRIPGKTLIEYRKKLQVNPNWLTCPVVNMKEVLDYLQVEVKVDNSIIFEALPIVLYPVDKIKVAFQETINSREAQITDGYFLHMVLYMLEKAVHFSGDGVWPTDLIAVPDFDLEGDDEFEDIHNVDEDVELEGEDLDGVPDDIIDDDELIE